MSNRVPAYKVATKFSMGNRAGSFTTPSGQTARHGTGLFTSHASAICHPTTGKGQHIAPVIHQPALSQATINPSLARNRWLISQQPQFYASSQCDRLPHHLQLQPVNPRLLPQPTPFKAQTIWSVIRRLIR